jgi:GntR family transcriptional regulator/MocR family aminotransferase
MKRVAASFLPPITLASRAKSPLYRQAYDWFRQAILDGRLRPGQRVPSTRNLAADLKISRIPVMAAYEQLQAEGYFETFTGAGTCVARSIPDEISKAAPVVMPGASQHVASPRASASRVAPVTRKQSQTQAPRRISRRATAMQTAPQTWLDTVGAFRVSLPALDHFPVEIWSKLVNRHSRRQPRSAMAYGNAMGYLPFREAVAEYLGAMRAVRCDASQILVTTGSQQALQLSAQVLLDEGDRVWIEEPGYHGARHALMTAGAQLVPVPVDREGLQVQEGIARAPRARAAYITPSHQYPLGVTMSAARRMLLLQWAARAGAWIIEDDYDSEYRFGARPIAALQGLDSSDRVIYAGTFNKVVFPSLRLGYAVIPRDLVPAFSTARDATDVFSSTLYQAVMTDFIRDGHFARHIRRMRMLYGERRQALVDAIAEILPGKLEVVGAEAGMHLVALPPRGVSDVGVAKKAARLGVSAQPLSSCYTKQPARGGLILGYGGTDQRQIEEGLRKLKLCI